MTKQIVTSSGSGASASATSDVGVESFERLLKGFQSQLAGFRTDDTVLIGNCPQNVTDEEINKFFCGFATIVKLQRVAFKSLTTNVFIAKFDSTESASRSKVLNTLALNGKKILLLQPDEKHFFNKKNVVELNGLQEHSEEVIYDHMSTFGNVSFVLKTSTVTYIVFEELSAVESSCRCDYLDQYPVTIRSVLDCPAAGAGGPGGSSIETCILEQIDQNSSLLADEDEGQINNFMQLLDMENLDEYLEQDEKEKSSASDKPLLEVGNEEIIVTEDEAARSEGDKEADVAAIEKQALQLHQFQREETAGTVLVDNRAKRILNLSSNLFCLTDLPQLNVAVRRVSHKVKIRPKKGALPTKHKESKKKKHSALDSSASKKVVEASSDHHVKKQEEPDKYKERKAEPSVEKKKTNKKETVSEKEVLKNEQKSDKEKSKKKHTKKQNPVPVTEQTQNKPTECNKDENDGEIKTEVCETKSSDKMKGNEHEANATIVEHKQKEEESKQQKKSKIAQESEKVETSDSKPKVSESTSEKPKAIKEEQETTNIHQKSELPHSKKSVFVQLTKLTSKQIRELSLIHREAVTSHAVVDGDVPEKVKKRKPGPAKGAMREKPMHAEKQDKPKKAEKRGLSDDETEPSTSSVAEVGTKSTEKSTDTHSTKKNKKPKLDISPEKVKLEHPDKETPAQEQTKSSTVEGVSMSSEVLEAPDDSEQKTSETTQSKVENPNVDLKQSMDEPAVLPESTGEVAQSKLLEKNSNSVPDVCNTVEICQTESAADVESDEERPLVMDISFDMQEEVIGKQSLEEKNHDRKVVALDSKSAALLKGKTHDRHLLFLDVLPRVAVKIRRVTASDYIVTKPKEHVKPSSGHHEKHPPKKVSFESSAVKKKEDKPEKPRKTNLDRIDSKFLPANSKLKSKIKSKTEINHKKHLPVPELPIELKTHLNTSFKIPKKNSSVKPQSIVRNASELDCLHKERENDHQRKRFQKERRPRPDGPGGPGGRDRNQNRPESSNNVRQKREPSPVPDFFDPAFDDHSPSPQRIPPTPPSATETPTVAPTQTSQRDGNRRPAVQNRGNNTKPSFQEIWNIPEKKPEVWAKSPWGSSSGGPTTIDSGDTWDSEPVQPAPERNMNTRPNVTRDNRAPMVRAPKSGNTIDSGESWSPGGGAAAPRQKSEQPQPSRTIDDGESWSPGTNKREQQPQRGTMQDRRPPPQFSARRSRSPHQVQLTNTIAGGDMWDLDQPSARTSKLPSPKRNIHQNPLLSGGVWDDDGDFYNEPAEDGSPAQFDRRPSIEQWPSNRILPVRQQPPERRRLSRSPVRQRSRSPGLGRRSMDRPSPDRRNFDRSRSRDQRSQSPMARQLSSDRRANRPPDHRRNLDRDQPPFDQRRGNFDRSPLRGSPSRMPFMPGQSCSPRPLSSTDVWGDAGTSSRTNMPAKRNVADNTIQGGGTWDDEIVPLRGAAERESLQDHRRRYAPDRLSPRSSSHDRLPPERRNQTFDRSPLREGGDNRRWSRDRSPNRRKGSRSRSPAGWRQNMERSPVRRRLSVGGGSPSYQKALDYWKAVEDREGGMDASSDRRNVERFNEFGHAQSPESWDPPVRDGSLANRHNTGRIDRDTPWANEPKPRHQAMDDSQYSPSKAFDTISSDDECDFTNPRRGAKKSTVQGRESFETIPLKIPSRVPLDELPLASTSRGSLNSLPPSEKDSCTKEQKMDGALSPQSEAYADGKQSALENLKQRAERLKKLEEMKLARQKLLAQIKQTYPQSSEVEMSKPNQTSKKFDDPKPLTSTSNSQVLVATASVSTDNAPLSSVDSLRNKPLFTVPAMPIHLPQIPSVPPPLLFGNPVQVPPLPSEAPPPPPPEEPRPPEPVDTMIPPPSSAWIPSTPSFAPIPHIDVSQPPPNLANPLLNAMPPSPHYGPDQDEPFDDRSNNTFNPQFPPSYFVDKSRRTQQNRGQNFNMPPEDRPFQRIPPEENDFINPGMLDFNESNNEQRHPDSLQHQQQQPRFGGNRQFMRQQQEQQQQKRDPRQNNDGNIYGGGQFNRNNNPGNNFNNNNRGNNFNNNPGNNFRNNNNPGNNFNNNRGNNFNNNPGNNFNNNNRGNNFNNNPGNNFRNNNNPGNKFNNNNPGNNFRNNNFRNNNRGNNFNNNPDDSFDNNFGDNFNNNPGNNFNNNSGDNFNNHPGSNFNNNRGNNFNNSGDNLNNDPDDNFNNNPDDNFNNPENNFFNNNMPGNNFNNNPGNFFSNNNRGGRGGGRGRFNNNQQQQRFNFQQQNRNPQFNNNRNNQQQQQQRFLMQQEEMFDEGCFDMNAVDNNDGGDANEWDDLE